MFRLYGLRFTYIWFVATQLILTIMPNYKLDIALKFYLKGLESFQFSPMDIPFTNSQIDCFRYDSLHSI